MFRKNLAPKTIEEIWREIPKVDLKGGVSSGPVDQGEGQQVLYYMGDQVGRDVYNDFLQAMERAGFHRRAQMGEHDGDPVVNTTYEKDDLLVSASYSDYWKRLYIEACVDEYTPDWTGEQIFAEVPEFPDASFAGAPMDYGAGNYVRCIDLVSKDAYEAYFCILKDAGFVKISDNGVKGLSDSVYTQTWRKARLVLHAVLIVKKQKLYLSACYDTPISKHLFCDEKGKNDLPAHARTTLHQMEMFQFGNSFVVQLRNGHFLISDGGTDFETPYLVDYLESLVPEGDKPVVEGWFISHGHRDHCGVLRFIGDHPELAQRIYVEGVYYCEPNDIITAGQPGARSDMICMKRGIATLRTTGNTAPELYRPVTGQRFFFADITVDVVLAQEQLTCYDYDGLTHFDYNDSSTWLMLTIEGQKVLLGGDGDRGGMRFVMDTYDRDYMTLDFFSVLHHTMNTWDVFTDFCTVKTALFTRRDIDIKYNVAANQHLIESVEEWFATGDGTRVYTFPYSVGESVCRAHIDWIYHKDIVR